MTEIRRGLTNRWRRERALGRSERIIREKRANKPGGLEDGGSILYFVYNRKKRTVYRRRLSIAVVGWRENLVSR